MKGEHDIRGKGCSPDLLAKRQELIRERENKVDIGV